MRNGISSEWNETDLARSLELSRNEPELPIWIFASHMARFPRPGHNEFATGAGPSEIRGKDVDS